LLGSFAKGQITVFIAFFCFYYGSMLLNKGLCLAKLQLLFAFCKKGIFPSIAIYLHFLFVLNAVYPRLDFSL
jgi:hypothetical protein